MTRAVTVVDYGIGNLHSVRKALEHEGASVTLTSSPAEVAAAERLVLPGVGAFGDGMRELRARHLIDPILQFASTGRPLLGICLGMQLLLSESEEFGRHEGLGLIPGTVRLIQPTTPVKVPHVGWNALKPAREGAWRDSLLADLEPATAAYFVHSFVAQPLDPSFRLADVDYGGLLLSAAVSRGAITGCQFHPEKSGPAGLKVLARFLSC